MRELNQHVGSACDGGCRFRLADLANYVVGESKLATDNYAEGSFQLLVQLLDFLTQELWIVSSVHSVVGVRRCDHHSYAVAGRREAHFDRFLEAV